MAINSIHKLAKLVQDDPAIQQAIKDNPIATIQTLASPLEQDVLIYRIIVSVLGLAIVITLIGALILVMDGKPIPDGMVAIGSSALGALAGLLAPSPSITK